MLLSQPPSATLIASVISAGASVTLGLLNIKLSKKNLYEARNEERTYALRSGRVLPYIEKLQELSRQAGIVKLNIEQIGKLPYSGKLLKDLLVSTGELQKFQRSFIDLAGLGSAVLVGIELEDLDEFLVQGASLGLQFAELDNLVVSAPELNKKLSSDFMEKYEPFRVTSAILIANLREYISRPFIERRTRNSSSHAKLVKGINEWIRVSLATVVSVGFASPEPTWRALWRIHTADVDLLESFEKLFQQMMDEMKTGVPGLIDSSFEKNVMTDQSVTGFAALLTFSGNESLALFLTSLPTIKSRSQLLWKAPFQPEIRSFPQP